MKQLFTMICLFIFFLTGCASKVDESKMNARMSGATRGALTGGLAGVTAVELTDLSFIPTVPVGVVAGLLLGKNLEEHYKSLTKQGVTFITWGDEVFLYVPSDALFPVDDPNLTDKGLSLLHRIKTIINDNPYKHVFVSAYTDDLGTKAQREAKSEQQARAVAGYFWTQGISRNQLIINGFSDNNPVASNRLANGNAMNRRVVIVLK